MRIGFWDIFKENQNGSISPISTIRVGGVTLSSGVSFTKGVTFGGINFFNYYGMDLEVEEENGIKIIKGIHTQ